MKFRTSILIILLISTVVSARQAADSLFNPVSYLRAQKVYPFSSPENSIDPASGHIIQVSLYRNQINLSSQSMFFYNNLKRAAERTYITRRLHQLLVRDPRYVNIPSANTRRSESEYTVHEGKIIRNIHFRTTSIFAPHIDIPNHSPQSRIEQIGSSLHISTNENVIRNHLLFTSGDFVDPYLLADNERILRLLPYIEDARVYVVDYHDDSDVVDIVVVTQDRWSRGFDLDMSEIDEGRFEFYDKNILGLGQEIQTNLLFDGNKDRLFGYQANLNINNIKRTFINSEISYRNHLDNRMIYLRSERNFLTPTMKYAGGLEFTGSKLTDDFTFPDTSFVDQRLNFHQYDYWFGRSFLLPVSNENMYTRRNIYITARFNRSIFFERPDISESARYIYHNKNLYLLGLTYTQLGYMQSRFIYGFGPTEDIPLGSKIEATLGYENNQFFPRFYAGMGITHSHYFNNTIYIKNSVSIGGFNNKGTWEQGVISIQTSGFSRLLDFNTHFFRQFFAMNITRGIRRFDDEIISISHRHGIRGLRSDELRGRHKLTLQLETLLYAKKSWYGFRYAFYTMADLGWIGSSGKMILNESFYSGLGIGMRVRNEHFILPTLQFRFAWFPRVPDAASKNLLYLMSERNRFFDEFRVTSPDLIPYR